MTPSVQDARPPYVTFEQRAVEDRGASIAAGHYVARNENYAIITPQGSKDRIERQADDWIAHLKAQVQQQRFPQPWLEAYSSAYSSWQRDQTIPENGTALLTWPPLSPAQKDMLLRINIRTVEDLAAANEESISRMGMGGRSLKDRAVQWLTSARDVGQGSERISALEQRLVELATANKDLAEVNCMLREQLGAPPNQAVGDSVSSSDLLDE
jgi:hypothetical protein